MPYGSEVSHTHMPVDTTGSPTPVHEHVTDRSGSQSTKAPGSRADRPGVTKSSRCPDSYLCFYTKHMGFLYKLESDTAAQFKYKEKGGPGYVGS